MDGDSRRMKEADPSGSQGFCPLEFVHHCSLLFKFFCGLYLIYRGKERSLDKQLRANNSCWLTLRECGIHLPCITVLSILPEKLGSLKINTPAPDSQIIRELQRLLCSGTLKQKLSTMEIQDGHWELVCNLPVVVGWAQLHQNTKDKVKMFKLMFSPFFFS